MLYHLEHVSVPLDGSHVLVHFFLLSRIIFFYNLFLVIEKKKIISSNRGWEVAYHQIT